jgi:hypothetical protein
VSVDVRSLLEDAGVAVFREARGELYAPCPNPDHEDNHPSWSMNVNTLAHFCFSCGYRGSLRGLLKDLTGAAPSDLDREIAVQGFLRKMKQAREEPDEILDEIEPILTEWSLEHHFRPMPQRYLDFKHLHREACDRYEVRFDSEGKRWVLPLRSPKGELLGAQYRQKGFVRTLPKGAEKSQTLFGFPQCREFDHCVLVESPLDAVRLFGLGIPALSSLGAFVSAEQVKLLARTFTRVYLALDDDKTGHQSTEIVAPMLERRGTAVGLWDYTGLTDDEGKHAKDVGDVEDDGALLGAWERTMRYGLG